MVSNLKLIAAGAALCCTPYLAIEALRLIAMRLFGCQT